LQFLRLRNSRTVARGALAKEADFMPAGTLDVDDTILEVLACPHCRAPLEVWDERLLCTSCPFVGTSRAGVMALAAPGASFFDKRHQSMRHIPGNGEWRLCYEKQLAYIRKYLTAGTRALDVGCGPAILYDRDPACFLMGLDASGPSLTVNQGVDLRVHGTAAMLPVADQAIDVIICLYSIHHMIGRSIRQNAALVRRVFHEFNRVLRPGGHLFVCEVNPSWPVALAQRVLWNPVRRLLGERLDQHFWTRTALEDLGREYLPGAQFKVVTTQLDRLALISPVFTMPWLKCPRFLFPFQANLFHWRTGTRRQEAGGRGQEAGV
jgi:SAM-dependent methyltransferase